MPASGAAFGKQAQQHIGAGVDTRPHRLQQRSEAPHRCAGGAASRSSAPTFSGQMLLVAGREFFGGGLSDSGARIWVGGSRQYRWLALLARGLRMMHMVGDVACLVRTHDISRAAPERAGGRGIQRARQGGRVGASPVHAAATRPSQLALPAEQHLVVRLGSTLVSPSSRASALHPV